MITAKPTEPGSEELKGLLPTSGKKALSVKGTQVPGGRRRQNVAVFLGASVDYWLVKILLSIIEFGVTQIYSIVSQGASVQCSFRWSVV